jgi:AraC-like DNA-binding protein
MDFEESTWNAVAVGELVEVAPSLSSPLQRENFATAISSFIDQTPSKNVASLARQLNISKGTVAEWQKGVNSPQFDTLLLISRLLGTDPRSFLLEKPTISSFAPVKIGSDVHPIILRESRTALSMDELRQALKAVLTSDEYPSPSISEVAKRLGYRRWSSLYARFPELCRAITAKHQRQNPNYRRLQRSSMSQDELRQALEGVLTSDEYPSSSVDEIARRLGYRSSSPLYRRFPELCHAISARHQEQYNIEHLRPELEAILECIDSAPALNEVAKRLGCPVNVLRKRFPELCSAIVERHFKPINTEDLHAALKRELRSNREPRSMREVAKDLGYPVKTLRGLFPDVCREISAQGQAYHRKHNRLRMQTIQNEVRRVVLTIHAEYAYPSQRKVMERIDRSCVCPPIFGLEAYSSWNEIMRELGYRT